MRRILLFGFAIALSSSLSAFAQSRTVEETVNLAPGGSLSLTATKGSVRLIAWDRPEVQIKARIEADEHFDDQEYAQRAVEATKVAVTGQGDSVQIRSDYDGVPGRDRGWWGNDRQIPAIHYDITAPKQVNVTLDIDRSNSEISGFSGRMTIDADRSELRVADITGELRVEIDRGGQSRFENVSGSFSLEGDRTDVEVAVAKLTDRSHVELDRGDARIRVNERQGLTVQTDIERRGSFESDLPMQMSGGTEESPEGTINGGGPRLTVVAHRAHVRLAKLR